MNWFDYTRGYEDGMDEYRNTRNNGNLLVILLHFAFSMAVLLLQLSWHILKGLAGLLWAIIKLIAGRRT